MDLILAVKDAHRTERAGRFINAILGVFEDSIVGSIAGLVIGSTIKGSVISALDSELSLFLFLHFLVVDDRSAVAGTMIYMPLISFLARVQEDGKVMKHFLSRNIFVYPPNPPGSSIEGKVQK